MGSIDWIKDNGQSITLNDREETTQKAIELGWTLASKAKKEPITLKSSVNGDKGSGVFGSIEWHTSAINGAADKQEIIDYLKSIELTIDARGGLDKVRAKALEVIGKNYDNGTTDS